jgi:hypothetical protein
MLRTCREELEDEQTPLEGADLREQRATRQRRSYHGWAGGLVPVRSGRVQKADPTADTGFRDGRRRQVSPGRVPRLRHEPRRGVEAPKAGDRRP